MKKRKKIYAFQDETKATKNRAEIIDWWNTNWELICYLLIHHLNQLLNKNVTIRTFPARLSWSYMTVNSLSL